MDFTIEFKKIDNKDYLEVESLCRALDNLGVVAVMLHQSGSATTLSSLAEKLRKLVAETS